MRLILWLAILLAGALPASHAPSSFTKAARFAPRWRARRPAIASRSCPHLSGRRGGRSECPDHHARGHRVWESQGKGGRRPPEQKRAELRNRVTGKLRRTGKAGRSGATQPAAVRSASLKGFSIRGFTVRGFRRARGAPGLRRRVSINDTTPTRTWSTVSFPHPVEEPA